MPAPQITIHGNLEDLFGVKIEDAQLSVQLCGFGSQIPRVSGTALIAQVAPDNIDCPAGTFSFLVWGNDVITPGGTFYTIQVLDANGNVVQTNAYQFTGTENVDLSTVVPFDPYVPPTPPAPQPGTLDVVVAYDPNPIFNALNTAGIIEFEMVLTGNVLSSTLINLTPGQIVSFVLQQDGVGGRTFVWPGNINNPGIIDPTANAVCVQSFIVRSDGNLYPIGPMTIN